MSSQFVASNPQGWSPDVQAWLARRVTQDLDDLRDFGAKALSANDRVYLTLVRLNLLDIPSVFAAVVQWYCALPRRAAAWIERDRYDPLDDSESSSTWCYQSHWVLMNLHSALEACADGQYTSLEEWLAALSTGALRSDPPVEEHFLNLLPISEEQKDDLESRHRAISRTWPRLCKGCGSEFRPDRMGLKRCGVCRAKGRKVGAR